MSARKSKRRAAVAYLERHYDDWFDNRPGPHLIEYEDGQLGLRHFRFYPDAAEARAQGSRTGAMFSLKDDEPDGREPARWPVPYPREEIGSGARRVSVSGP